MNFERFELKEIELSYGDLNESLRCLFHSIVFHRSLGGFRPIDHESEKFPSIVYTKSGDESLNTIIETGIQKINLAVNKAFQQLNNNNNNNNNSSSSSSPNNNNNNTPSSILSSSSAVPLSDRVSINVHLGFYELTLKKGWLGEKEEKVFWERWVIPITVTRVSGINNGIINNNNNNINNNNNSNNSNNNNNNNTNNISSIITEAMFSIISYVNEKKDHIPPLKQTQTQCSFPFEISFFIGNKNEESSWGSALTRMLKQGPPMLMKP